MQPLIEAFHSRLLADPELSHLYGGLDWKPLVRHEVAFVSELLGGPKVFDHQDLDTLLNPFNIGDQHFDLLAMHLMLALEAVSVPAEDRALLMRRLSQLRPQIVRSLDPDSLLGRGLQRYQDLMSRAAQELERATEELVGVRNLLLNQQRLRELVFSLDAAQGRISDHTDLCTMIGELKTMVRG